MICHSINNKIQILNESYFNNDPLPLISIKRRINKILPSVGKIEYKVGDNEVFASGWLIRQNLVVTASHVVKNFSTRISDYNISIMQNDNFQPRITFTGMGDTSRNITRIRYAGDWRNGWDLCVFEIDPCNLPIIKLTREFESDDKICIIGYPMEGEANLHGVKQISFGSLQSYTQYYYTLDCESKSGFSGGVIFDYEKDSPISMLIMKQSRPKGYFDLNPQLEEVLDRLTL